MKKRISALISVLLCLCMVACGEKLPAPQESNEQSEDSKEISIPTDENVSEETSDTEEESAEKVLTSYNDFDTVCATVRDLVNERVIKEDGPVKDYVPPYDGNTGFVSRLASDSFYDTHASADRPQTPQNFVTDENHIYYFNHKYLTVFTVDDGTIKKTDNIELPLNTTQQDSYAGILVYGNTVLVVRKWIVSVSHGWETIVYVYFYEVTENGTLEQKETFTQTGYLSDIRIDENRLILTTGYSIPWDYGSVMCDEWGTTGYMESGTVMTAEDAMNALPIAGFNQEKIAPENIYFSESSNGSSFLITSCIDLETKESHSLSVNGNSCSVYVSENNIYKINGELSEAKQYSVTIDRFTVENGIPCYTGSTRIDGQIFCPSSFCEKDGYLRIALAKDGKYGFAMLDKNLELVDEIYKELSYENITTAIFTEKEGYYAEIGAEHDGIPKNTLLLAAEFTQSGEVKEIAVRSDAYLPDYAIPFSDKKLFGYTSERRRNEETGFIEYAGTKISIYDHSSLLEAETEYYLDESAGRETFYLSQQDVLNTDTQRKIFLLPYRNGDVHYMGLFSYDDDGATLIGAHTEKDIQLDSNTFQSPFLNGFIIGDYVYIVVNIGGEQYAYSYSATDFAPIGKSE